MSEGVLVDCNDEVAHVRLNRPEKKNALNTAMFDGILSAADHIRNDLPMRAVVLSGEWGSFSGETISGGKARRPGESAKPDELNHEPSKDEPP
jgi:enoyl-CoA hydratase/carnithine racemase